MATVLYPILANRLFLDLTQSKTPETQSVVSDMVFATVGTIGEGEGDLSGGPLNV